MPDSNPEGPPIMPTFQPSARYCMFGAEKLLGFISAMIAEIPGVRAAKDIECIHRMRVASRRTRSGLRLFGTCFPGYLLKRWQKGVRAVTSNLGAARDLDVQIDVLKKFRSAKTQIEYKLGINHVLYHIRQKRRDMQRDVIKSIDKIEKNKLLQEMVVYLQESLGMGVPDKTAGSSQFILHQARTNILDHLDDLMRYRLIVDQEDADDELHQMRIAAKRVRYTMEIFSDLYENKLSEYIRAVKKIQKYLGEMHDCVVWLGYLPKFIKTERKHTVRYKNAEPRLKSIIQGVHLFEVDRKQTRLTRYRDFYKHWQKITTDNLFGKLQKYLATRTASIRRDIST